MFSKAGQYLVQSQCDPELPLGEQFLVLKSKHDYLQRVGNAGQFSLVSGEKSEVVRPSCPYSSYGEINLLIVDEKYYTTHH